MSFMEVDMSAPVDFVLAAVRACWIGAPAPNNSDLVRIFTGQSSTN